MLAAQGEMLNAKVHCVRESDAGERRLPACSRRQLADDTLRVTNETPPQKTFRQAAEKEQAGSLCSPATSTTRALEFGAGGSKISGHPLGVCVRFRDAFSTKLRTASRIPRSISSCVSPAACRFRFVTRNE
jgi:hypothetical protein